MSMWFLNINQSLDGSFILSNRTKNKFNFKYRDVIIKHIIELY